MRSESFSSPSWAATTAKDLVLRRFFPFATLRVRTGMDARRHGILLIAAAALLWSTGGIGIKAVAEPPLKVTFYRSLFAAIALMLFLPRQAWMTKRWSSNAAFIGSIISYAACLTTFVVATKW